jgi:hypothetical protein
VSPSHPRFGEPIELRRLVRGAAVAAERFAAHIIGHDQQEVGRSLLIRIQTWFCG